MKKNREIVWKMGEEAGLEKILKVFSEIMREFGGFFGKTLEEWEEREINSNSTRFTSLFGSEQAKMGLLTIFENLIIDCNDRAMQLGSSSNGPVDPRTFKSLSPAELAELNSWTIMKASGYNAWRYRSHSGNTSVDLMIDSEGGLTIRITARSNSMFVMSGIMDELEENLASNYQV